MLSEKRGEEAGQEDGEKPREKVASGKTNAPTISPTEARGPALRVSGVTKWGLERKGCHLAWTPPEQGTHSIHHTKLRAQGTSSFPTKLILASGMFVFAALSA